MTDTNTIAQHLRTLQSELSTAQLKLDSGEDIDLTASEKNITRVCQDIAALPKAQRDTLQMPLLNLLDEADKLYQMIQLKHAELAQKIKGLNPQRQAMQAYGKAAQIKKEDE